MLLLDRQTSAEVPRHSGPNPVQLRFLADGQLLELPLGKTTIGSGPRCNLRIQQPGVQPLHCLIVHGPEGLSVRRWAADTQLNGVPFDDAPLEAGDCLLLGSVELELVKAQPTTDGGGRLADCVATATDQCDELMDVVQESVDAITSIDAAVGETAADTADLACEIEHLPTLVEPVGEAVAAAADAAEIVFRELQAACVLSRGRSRKILAALRAEREQNQELRERLAEAGEELAALNRQRTAREGSLGVGESKLRDWQREVQDLRHQIGECENRLADHSRRMTELQQELVVARSSDALMAAPANPAIEMPVLEEAACGGIETERPVGGQPSVVEPWTDAPVAMAPTVASSDWKSRLSREPLPYEVTGPAVDEPELAAQEPVSVSENSLPQVALPAAEWANPLRKSTSVWGGEPLVGTPSAVVDELPHADAVVEPWRSPATRAANWLERPAKLGLPGETGRSLSEWGAAASNGESAHEDEFGASRGSNAIQVDEPAWAGGVIAASANEQARDDSPFAESSNWSQGGPTEPPSFGVPELAAEERLVEQPAAWGSRTFSEEFGASELDAPRNEPAPSPEGAVNPWAVAAVQPAVEVVESAPPKEQSASFIERYSHLLAEGTTANESAVAAAPQPPLATEPARPKPGTMGVVHNENATAPVASSDSEESIEQYMAKLLQRVRGDGVHVAASQAAPADARRRNRPRQSLLHWRIRRPRRWQNNANQPPTSLSRRRKPHEHW